MSLDHASEAKSEIRPDMLMLLRALEIANDSGHGQVPPSITNLLERHFEDLWGRIKAQPKTYVMTEDEFALFNLHRDRHLFSADDSESNIALRILEDSGYGGTVEIGPGELLDPQLESQPARSDGHEPKSGLKTLDYSVEDSFNSQDLAPNWFPPGFEGVYYSASSLAPSSRSISSGFSSHSHGSTKGSSLGSAPSSRSISPAHGSLTGDSAIPSDIESVIIETPKKPICWDHGCDGRQFSTFSNLLRHQREKSSAESKSTCHRCGAEFTRKTARDRHLIHDMCKPRLLTNIPFDLYEQLRAFPLFVSAPDTFLAAIGKLLRPQSHVPQDYIITEGDEAKAMYWLLQGNVAVTSRDGEMTYAELEPGAFFGEIGILMSIPRTATVIARTKCLLAKLKKEDLQEELPDFPEVERALRYEASERLSDLERKKRGKPVFSQTDPPKLSNSASPPIGKQSGNDLELDTFSLSSPTHTNPHRYVMLSKFRSHSSEEDLERDSPIAEECIGRAHEAILLDTSLDQAQDPIYDMAYNDEDPLGTQMGKFYNKNKSQLPNQERTENLTRRMMAMSLKREEREQMRKSQQPTSAPTDIVKLGGCLDSSSYTPDPKTMTIDKFIFPTSIASSFVDEKPALDEKTMPVGSSIVEQDDANQLFFTKPTEQAAPKAVYARALYDYEASDKTALKFRQGDIVQVITQLQAGWWDGILDDKRGWFPSTYCVVMPDPEETVMGNAKQQRGSGASLPRKLRSDEMNKMHNHEQALRAKVNVVKNFSGDETTAASAIDTRDMNGTTQYQNAESTSISFDNTATQSLVETTTQSKIDVQVDASGVPSILAENTHHAFKGSLPGLQILHGEDYHSGNWIKSFIENLTGESWDWWPFKPRYWPLKPDEVRIQWHCDSGHAHTSKMPKAKAEIVRIAMTKESTKEAVTHNPQSTSAQRTVALAGSDSASSSDSSSHFRGDSSASQTSSATSDSDSSDIPDEDAGSHKAQNSEGNAPNAGKSVVVDMLPPSKMKGYVLFGVQGSRRLQSARTRLTQIDVEVFKDDDSFFDEMNVQYKKLRGYIRWMLSIWIFHTCEFIMFHKANPNEIEPGPEELPCTTDRDYQYIAGRSPPVLSSVFNRSFYGCNKACIKAQLDILCLFHECAGRNHCGKYRVLERLPKRRRKWELDRDEEKDEAWGLNAVFGVSFHKVVLYHLLILAGPLFFWGLWLRKWPTDWQNASVPFFAVVVLLSLFWLPLAHNVGSKGKIKQKMA